jgi:hypothetical protein
VAGAGSQTVGEGLVAKGACEAEGPVPWPELGPSVGSTAGWQGGHSEDFATRGVGKGRFVGADSAGTEEGGSSEVH